MRIVIVGGGVAAVYLANKIKESHPSNEVVIVSDEPHMPYDRIHLCRLLVDANCMDEIALELDNGVKVELNQKITSIDTDAKRVFSQNASFLYDKLIIATGSRPKELFDTTGISNVATFRSSEDSAKILEGIAGKNVVIVGAGPIALEFLDTLRALPSAKSITLLVRKDYLYSPSISIEGMNLLKGIFNSDPRVTLSFNDQIEDKVVENGEITKIITKKHEIDEPFLVFGVGIDPNVDFAKGSLETNRGILVDNHMRASKPDIYVVGEAAEIASSGFVAGRVRECHIEADVAIENLFGGDREFKEETAIDGLKVGSFLFADVTSVDFNPNDENNENILISHGDRIDQYIVNNDKLKRFIGINTNVNVMALKDIIEKNQDVDASYLYSNRLMSEKGRLICSCVGTHEQELVDIIRENAVMSYGELKGLTEAGRVCGRCKPDIIDIIEVTPVDPELAAQIKAEKIAAAEAAELAKVKARIDKYNRLNPKNQLNPENLKEALESFNMNKEYNRWVSMITASLRLHPRFEDSVDYAVTSLNKIPIIWLELSDCTGNSEAFIKTSHPKVDDLILKYISLDYHDLLMAAAGDRSEEALDSVIKNDAGKYILIVEGAVPMGMDGKYLRIGPHGETGIDLLRRVAKDAAAVMAVGSCAYDGGVVAAEPNPTGAVGVAEALQREDIINLPGCPTNPVNIVGTLLHYIMFDELPELDEKNRPKWAYSYLIHDNCERRGHFDNDEFVLEWGDEGAKQGWCLFKMGCKGPYANLNCPQVKFNEGTSWPVQAGHGCFGCGEGKIAFDLYANTRELES